MDKRIAILGVGAVGSYLGAFLTREGYDVTPIDMWGRHVDEMRERGLHVSGTQGDFTVDVNALHLADAQSVGEPFDIVFLSVKSYDTEWAAHFAKRLLASDGIVVGAQNCMNDEIIASIVGHNRVVGCVLSGITVALWEPAHVERGGQPGRGRGHDVFRVGELHGAISPRVEALVEALSCIDGARATSNIWGERWSKLTTNASSNPVGAMTGLGSQGVAEDPRARAIRVHICKESALVGQALGYGIESVAGVPADTWARADQGDVFEELEAKFRAVAGAADWKSSMGQDVAKGRRTEIQHMNGYISRRGREAGVPTPVNDAVVQVVADIDARRLKPGIDNVQRVLETAGL